MKQIVDVMGELIIILAFGAMLLRFFIWMGTQVLL